MTPLDVVKTRLQVQQKTMLSEKCFVYCNGLMDHLCPCYPTAANNGPAPSLVNVGNVGNVVIPPSSQTHYKGTIVSNFELLCVTAAIHFLHSILRMP